jgi:hypothetical protein
VIPSRHRRRDRHLVAKRLSPEDDAVVGAWTREQLELFDRKFRAALARALAQSVEAAPDSHPLLVIIPHHPHADAQRAFGGKTSWQIGVDDPFRSVIPTSGWQSRRWDRTASEAGAWAIDGRITLSAALPLVEAKQGRPVEGLVEISGQEVFDLFDAGTNKKSTVRVQRFRRRLGAWWEKIVTPADGVPLKPSGVIIARTEAERWMTGKR